MTRTIDIGAPAKRLLKTLSTGGRLTLERRYPHPREYWSYEAEKAIPTRADASVVANLVLRKLVRVDTMDGMGDHASFVITPYGSEVLANKGKIPYEDEQDEMFSRDAVQPGQMLP